MTSISELEIYVLYDLCNETARAMGKLLRKAHQKVRDL